MDGDAIPEAGWIDAPSSATSCPGWRCATC